MESINGGPPSPGKRQHHEGNGPASPTKELQTGAQNLHLGIDINMTDSLPMNLPVMDSGPSFNLPPQHIPQNMLNAGPGIRYFREAENSSMNLPIPDAGGVFRSNSLNFTALKQERRRSFEKVPTE